MSRFSLKNVLQLSRQGNVKLPAGIEITEKKSKYRAQKEVIEGITFDSKKEASRYRELKGYQAIGVIAELQLQVPF